MIYFLNELIKDFNIRYSDGFILRIHHDNTINATDVICPYQCKHPNVDFCNMMHKLYIPPKVWRFVPAGHPLVDIIMSRDLDSVLTARERVAVDDYMPNATSIDNCEIEFILSTKNKKILLCNGYRYVLNQTTKNKKYWRCEDSDNCGAYVHTTLKDIYLKHNNIQHNHLADPDEVIINKLISKIRYRVMNEHLSASFVYEFEVARAKLTESQLAIMPAFKKIKSMLYMARASTIPPIPKTFEFDIPMLYQLNANSEKYLFADCDSRDFDRVLMYSSNRQLQILFDSEIIFCDGTFASSPPQFKQIYTIHAIYEEESFPCVFALCTQKNNETYDVIITKLKSAAKQMKKTFTPSLIMSDYESGFMEVVKKVYSNDNTRHVGCYFHTSQAIYRKVQEIGLQVPYNSTVWVRNIVRSLMALPLLYRHLVNDQFDHIVNLVGERLKQAKKLKRTTSDSDQCDAALEEIRLCEILLILLNYFERYWINTITPAMFCVQGLQYRTNNLAEGFHNRFSRRLNEIHANVWKVIATFIDEEYHAYQKMLLIRTGAHKKANATALQIAYQERINKLYVLYEKKKINATELLEDGLLQYIKSNVPAYVNVVYPSVMKSIDIKLKEFVETVVLQEGEKIQFCKAHDVEGTPSSYGKVYYAERRNDGIHLITTIKKGQKAAAGVLTVEVLDKENITAEADKQNEDDMQNITTTSELISCDEQSPSKTILTSSVVDNDDNDFEQSIVSSDAMAKIQNIELSSQSTNQKKIQKQIGGEIKIRNRLISQLAIWNGFAPSNTKRRTSTTKFTTGHKRTKKN
ncbi:unnamed protein product [Rotaria sordida]|uniref:MULE transposase domain-containing protein n=3 Tax=Rotaria sordida TaxID=392033 RepID=A0A814CWV1_9BILA|nr:unnamed protein product [Rotaria sordida]